MMKVPKFFFTIDIDWVRGSDIGLKSLIDICEQKQIKATLFVTGRFAEDYPNLIKELFERGYDLGTHGWEHGTDFEENFLTTTYEEQKRLLKLSTEALVKVTGAQPVIFRAPKVLINETTFQVLSEEKYQIDSSVPARRFDCGLGQVKSMRYFAAPVEPYYPSPDNLGIRGSSSILEVPPSAYVIPLNMRALQLLGLVTLKWVIWRLAQISPMLIFYCHPYEFVSPEYLEHYGNDPLVYKSCGPHNLKSLCRLLDYIHSLKYQVAFISQLINQQ
jgi:peptidoglycan-N-acetylglucosamine deacetylase